MNLNRNLSRLCLVFAIAILGPAPADASSNPNILLILMDDMGIGDLSCSGNSVFETPQIDRLSKQSIRFENFFVNASCSPTRAALMTGRYFVDAGVWGVHGGREYMHTDEVTLAQALQRGGYATGLFGKWHLGKSEDTKPYRRGFDESIHLVGRLYADTGPIVERNGIQESPKGWSVDLVTEWTKDFIRRKQAEGKPWFAMASYPQIHTQWTAKEEYIERYRGRGYSEGFELLAGYVAQTDEGVGRLIESITESDLAQNTVVVYLHDNGPINRMSNNSQFIADDEAVIRNAMKLRGQKGQVWDNGVRSPLFIRLPGGHGGVSIADNAHVMDLLPTICELAGVAIPTDTAGPLAGRSLKPLMDLGENANWSDRYLMGTRPTPTWGTKPFTSSGMHKAMPIRQRSVLRYEFQDNISIRDQRFKLVKFKDDEMLFDIQSDPSELVDLSDTYPNRKQKMSAAMKTWFEAFIDSPRCFTYPTSTIGVAGQVRSSVHIASAFEDHGVTRGSEGIRDWDDGGDVARFRIRVEQKGTYAVCLQSSSSDKAIDAQARFRIGIGEQLIEASLQQLADKQHSVRRPRQTSLPLTPGEYILSVELIDPATAKGRLQIKAVCFDLQGP
ncbi:sulfatase-like hydrolase/transferase [Crateriforma conspicua]|uniref:sulfatase-like hydrolase/transferase n=1 Tax=Crateriforma conspicua TaxID=2527996 RepID=UPI0011879721|nr:sulfatase-like hydrolase/transferase [Crateriforma conspicua]QDV62440.1 Arylsulfatase precursor [Crateriforma conspicua]